MSGGSDMFLQSHEKELTDERNLTDRSGWWKDTVKVGHILYSCNILVPLNEVTRFNSEPSYYATGLPNKLFIN